MSQALKTIILSVVATTVACGGGGEGGGGNVVTSNLTPSFVSDQVDAGGGIVSMTEDSVVGDVITIGILVTDAEEIYGAAFDLAYDPTVATFQGWAPGTLLEQGGNPPNYTVDAPRAGTVVVGASRTGNVPGVIAGGRTLIRLTFKVLQPGNARLSFRSASLTDSRIPPEEIPGLSWFGGSLVVV
jgi:hypothetical protein